MTKTAGKRGKQPRRGGQLVAQPRVPSEQGHGVKTLPRIAPFAILALAIAVVFGRAVTFQMIDWDDNVNVYANPAIITPTWGEFVGIWTKPYADLYVPLIYTTYLTDKAVAWVLSAIGGVSLESLYAGVLHFTNLFFHACSAAFVYLLIRRLGLRQIPAVTGALLFAIHPLQVEPVVWVTGRKDVLSGFCTLAALWCFIQWLDGARRRVLVLAYILYVLALLAKPSGIVTPLLAGAIAVFLGQPVRRWAIVLGPWLLIAVIWVAITQASQTGASQEDARFMVALWKRPFVAADSLLFYLRKLVWPSGLGPIYSRTNERLFQHTWIWFELPVVLAAAIALIFAPKMFRLAAVLFAIPLLPVLGLVPFVFQTFSNVADRYTYLSLMGIGLLTGYSIERIAISESARKAVLATAAIAMIALGMVAFRQVGYWREPVVFWQRELTIDPSNSSALYNLASTYKERGELETARTMMQKIMDNDSYFGRAFTGVMVLANAMGDKAGAVAAARRTLEELKPEDLEALVAHGTAYLQLERYEDAAKAFEMATVVDSKDADAFANWGIALIKLQDFAGAERVLRKAVSLSETHAAAHANLALALVRLGRIPEAMEQFRIAIRKDPMDEQSRARLSGLERGEIPPPPAPRQAVPARSSKPSGS